KNAGCISICRIVTLKVGGEDTAHGAPPGVGVPTNPRQFEMHPECLPKGLGFEFNFYSKNERQSSFRNLLIASLPRYSSIYTG
ncbi:MAG: hypothetical protein ABIW47_15810, partial [Ginsengibacter sp.]